jgi:hypothetical protein
MRGGVIASSVRVADDLLLFNVVSRWFDVRVVTADVITIVLRRVQVLSRQHCSIKAAHNKTMRQNLLPAAASFFLQRGSGAADTGRCHSSLNGAIFIHTKDQTQTYTSDTDYTGCATACVGALCSTSAVFDKQKAAAAER